MSSGVSPSRGARWLRRSRLVKPWGRRRKAQTAASRAWTRGLVRGIPAVRVPAGLMTGWVRAARAAAASVGAWVVLWAPRNWLPAVETRPPGAVEGDRVYRITILLGGGVR